ncbi:MAG: ABC transporter substrate-binding protein [Oscillospiraceae bacterium]|nr:ABC transporter substrate-binding protein [Oscillospiraceae bacterium]
MKNSRKLPARWGALLMAFALLMTLTACGDDEYTLSLKEGDTFTIAVAQEPDSLNPATSDGGLSEEFFLLVYDSLWRLDENGDPVACLAEDYSLSSDQLTWTIRLRQDVTFSDGSQLTSADVKFTYELMMRSSDLYAPYLEGITDIYCPDDYTVVISTSYVKGDMMYNTIPILPKAYWSSYSDSPGSYENTEMIGSGPFVYTATEDGWLLQARADYFGGAAQVGAVCFMQYETETAAARALSTGEVDACYGLSDVQLLTLESVPGVELIQNVLPRSEVWALALNTAEDSFFADQSMRAMIEYCLDRATIFSLLSGEAGEAGYVWASSGTDYALSLSDPRGYSLDTARSLLWNVAYDLDEDGYLEYYNSGDDEDEEIVLTLYSNAQDIWASTTGAVLVDTLGSLGIQVEWSRTDDDVTTVCKTGGSWDMCLCGWQGSENAAVAGYRFYSGSGDMASWSSSEYDNIYVNLRASLDGDTIRTLAGQLQQVVYDQCPYIILGYSCDVQAIRSDTWTGYEDIVAASGGLFGTGSAAAYMAVTRLEAEE